MRLVYITGSESFLHILLGLASGEWIWKEMILKLIL